MNTWMLSAEAEECRLLADDLAGQPEEPFLLSLASAFDQLHVQGPSTTPTFERIETGPTPSVAFHPYRPVAT
jgi:hypothetical protein